MKVLWSAEELLGTFCQFGEWLNTGAANEC
jgi:hypothetical protein